MTIRSHRRAPSMRRALVAVVLLALVAVSAPKGTEAVEPGLRLGVTHTEYSLDPWQPAEAQARGRALLTAQSGLLQNQHLFGWGTVNPQPFPGVYDWTTLDRRMALIRETGGTPVITLCCAPDWMTGSGLPGTPPTYNNKPPLTIFFDEFAKMSAEVAKRYPDVLHFQVWNEMKGFCCAAPNNRWKYEDYTALYNKVYLALKAVNPAIKVGGPYVHMSHNPPNTPGYPGSVVSGPWGTVDQRDLDVITYWLANKVGADFIAVDGGAALRKRDGTPADQPRWLVPPIESAQKFAAVNEWIRARTDLPIWWSEVYPILHNTSGSYTAQQEVDIWVNAMDVLADSGASVALFWQPEGSATHTGLWTAPTVPSGAQRTVVFDALDPWIG